MRFDEVRPAADDPVVPASLHELREIVLAVLEAADVASIVEVGAGAGRFTADLAGWAAAHGAGLVVVEADPGPGLRALTGSTGTLLLETDGPAGLAGCDPADAYILTGDANYHTVATELRLITARADGHGAMPLVLVGGIGWPTGRRDRYDDPGRLPVAVVAPYDFGGVLPWEAGTVAGGWRGAGPAAVARVEGGPGNGVLTAVEDFLAADGRFDALCVPCMTGVAFLHRRDAPWAGAVRRAVGSAEGHPLLARLEADRILLHLRLGEATDALARERRRGADRLAALQAELDSTRSEVAVLTEALRQLRS